VQSNRLKFSVTSGIIKDALDLGKRDSEKQVRSRENHWDSDGPRLGFLLQQLRFQGRVLARKIVPLRLGRTASRAQKAEREGDRADTLEVLS